MRRPYEGHTQAQNTTRRPSKRETQKVAARTPKAMALANRTLERGEKLASRFGAEALRLSDLPQRLHGAGLRPEWIDDQRLFCPRWLRAQGLRLSPLRLLPPAGLGRSAAHVLDRLTPRDAFVGNLSGAWRADLLRVAGFDEAMAYGAEDRNLGIRLNHAGVRGRRLRHALVCLHLEHARTWRHDAQVLENRRWNASLPAQTTLPRQSGLLDGGVTPASVAPPSSQAGCSESAGCDGPPVHPED